MSVTTKAMLRRALAEAHATRETGLATIHQAAAPCACQHQHQAAPLAAEMGATLHRGFRVAPVLTAGAAALGVLGVLGMVTAALLAVALTALALAVSSAVLLLLVRMIRKEMNR